MRTVWQSFQERTVESESICRETFGGLKGYDHILCHVDSFHGLLRDGLGFVSLKKPAGQLSGSCIVVASPQTAAAQLLDRFPPLPPRDPWLPEFLSLIHI